MRLLVHVAGEADLLLNSRDRAAPNFLDIRARRVEARRSALRTALAAPGGPGDVYHRLRKQGWDDDSFSTAAPSPLFGALAALGSTPDLAVLVLGTTQHKPDPLDTLPIARTLADVLNSIAADDPAFTVRTATAVAVHSLNETDVVDTITGHIGDATRFRTVLLTWGSGATALAMGTLTALSRTGLGWQLVLTSGPAAGDIIDPLDRLDTDPVVGVLVRWRMFAALDAAAAGDPPTVQLTDTQRHLVRRAVDRQQAGLQARDCASLRAVLADAVVRRDGTASLAVRRYITSRYEELLATDQATHPGAQDLLRWYERAEGGPPLGTKLREIRQAERADPTVHASARLPSYRWLFGPVVNSLQNIGKGSHRLEPPAYRDARLIGDYLSRYDDDAANWQDAELPTPPITPADTVLTVWLAGDARTELGTVGEQLSDHGLPTAVQDYLGVEQTQIRAVIFGVEGDDGSRLHAAADAERIRTASYGPANEAWDEPVERTNVDPAAIEHAIERRVTRDTGALLLIPTGNKPILLAMIGVMRRVGARHGIPLFVRETASPKTPRTYTNIHLWPALTGGDLPLLKAAKEALHTLELDVAWRLLAASAVEPAITDKARRLAATFASRQLHHDTQWLGPDSVPATDLHSRTTGLVVQRLALINQALAHATSPPDRIRLLVLAADALEAAIAANQDTGKPGKLYEEFRKKLAGIAPRHQPARAEAARILLILTEVRNRAPITHGTQTNPDSLVTDTANSCAQDWNLTPAQAAALPNDVPTLLSNAVTAAATIGLGQLDQRDGLITPHREVINHLNTATQLRRRQGSNLDDSPML